MAQPDIYILIPGRTSRQGTSLNEGKFTDAYVAETSTLFMNADDMTKHELQEGDFVRLRPEQGEIEIRCKAARKDELPLGLLFMPYGDMSSQLLAATRTARACRTARALMLNWRRLPESNRNCCVVLSYWVVVQLTIELVTIRIK